MIDIDTNLELKLNNFVHFFKLNLIGLIVMKLGLEKFFVVNPVVSFSDILRTLSQWSVLEREVLV